MTTNAATLDLARRTQAARRNYWAAVAGGNDQRIARAGLRLRAQERMLADATGSPAAAVTAERAYIASQRQH